MITDKNKPSFNLEVFEGPLDLLLHLIQKNKVNIENIPIAEITKQYIEYLEEMQRFDVETTSEFLTMAVHLLYIKSKMLLPKQEEEEDPRTELAERLMEYRKVKEIAEILKESQFSSMNLFFKEAESIGKAKPININLPIETLMNAFYVVLERYMENAPPTRSQFKGIIEGEQVTVEEMVEFVLKKLPFGKKMPFESLFMGVGSRKKIVAIFLAVLHLINRADITFFEKDDKVYLIKSGDNK